MISQNWKKYFILLILAFITILLFSSSTSPLFHLFFSNYSSHEASSIFVIINGWINGSIPYIDLVLNDGPLFYFIEAIGWFIGQKYGIFILEIINLLISLILMDKILQDFVSKKASFIFTLSMLIPFIATLSGGNSSEEFVLTLSILLFYITLKHINNQYFQMIMGMILGATFMIKISAGGMIYGIIIYTIIHQIKQTDLVSTIKMILWILLGMMIIILPFVIYYSFNNGLKEMIDAIFIYNLYIDFSNKTVLLHMLVKSIPVILMMIASMISFTKSKNDVSCMMLFGSIGLFITLFLGDVSWYKYIVMAIGMPLTLAIYNQLSIKFSKVAMLFNILCLIGIYFIPIKNYISYITTEDQTTYQELVSALKNYQKETDNKQFMMMNMPASIYLETHIIPDYKYFSKQDDFIQRNPSLSEEIYGYFSSQSQDQIFIMKSSGFISESIGHYLLVDMFYQGRTIYAIYEYLPDIVHEEG